MTETSRTLWGRQKMQKQSADFGESSPISHKSKDSVSFKQGRTFPKPRYNFTKVPPKLIYPSMSAYKIQDHFLEEGTLASKWTLARCLQFKEHEFVHELAKAEMTSFFPYHTVSVYGHKPIRDENKQKVLQHFDNPMLYGYVFIKQDRCYDEDRLKHVGRFTSIVKVYTGECIGYHKNGKPIWEPVRLPLAITGKDVQRLAVESAMHAPDKKLITFVPVNNMEVKFKPEFLELNKVIAMCAEKAKVMVVKFNHQTKLTQLMIGKMAATVHAQFLVPA